MTNKYQDMLDKLRAIQAEWVELQDDFPGKPSSPDRKIISRFMEGLYHMIEFLKERGE